MRMLREFALLPAVLLAGLWLPAPVAAQETDEESSAVSAGFQTYQRYCRSCHGQWGRGDGSVAKWLKVAPTNFTQLSETNDGVFPTERVARVIDGREEVATHGSRDMPIWGKVLGEEVEGDKQEVEKVVAERIDELVAVLRWFDRESPGGPKNDE